MHTCIRKPCLIYAVALMLGTAIANILPVQELASKPAATDNIYAEGWHAGCHSGVNSERPLYALLKDTPFKTKLVEAAGYKTGWNEGYTSCRIAQESVDRWIQCYLLIVTLLYAGTRTTSRHRKPESE